MGLREWAEWLSEWLRQTTAGMSAAVRMRSPRWPAVRDAHLKREPSCRGCGSKIKLNVHHIIPVHVDPTQELVADNLITLCEQPGGGCHLYIGHLRNWQSWNGSVRSDAAVYRRKVEDRP